jgi:hypothetical protein
MLSMLSSMAMVIATVTVMVTVAEMGLPVSNTSIDIGVSNQIVAYRMGPGKMPYFS